MPIRHNFVNPIADEPGFAGTKPSHWNDDHDLSGLVADDIIDFDDAVAASAVPSDFQPSIVTGNYYYSPHGLFEIQGLIADNLVAWPIWFSHSETWTRIGIKIVATEAGKNIRLGIYENGADNLPGALLSDCGTISLDSTGIQEITISEALAANTAYWLASVCDVDVDAPTAAVVGMTQFVGGTNLLTDINWLLGSADAVDPNSGASYGVGRVFSYAALPDPFGTIEYTSSTPAVWLRKV